MDQKEILYVVGELYLKTHLLMQELDKKNKELEELRTIIISLQKTHGTVSS